MMEERKRSGFFSHPMVGIIGSIASVIGILLAIYFYLQSEKYPELMYFVNPVKAIVVKTNQTSDLKVAYKENIIDTDITAVQIAIWNNGRQSIRRENILKSIILSTSNNCTILKATLRKNSRDVTNFSIKQDSTNLSKIIVDWKILESKDWAIIQLIYAGDPSVDIILTGVIENQKNIKQYEYSGNIKSAQDQITERQKGQRSATYGFMIMGAFIMFQGLYFINKIKKRKIIDKEIEEYKLIESDLGKVRRRRIELYNIAFPRSNYFSLIIFRSVEMIESYFPVLYSIIGLCFLVIGIYMLYIFSSSALPFVF